VTTFVIVAFLVFLLVGFFLHGQIVAQVTRSNVVMLQHLKTLNQETQMQMMEERKQWMDKLEQEQHRTQQVQERMDALVYSAIREGGRQ